MRPDRLVRQVSGIPRGPLADGGCRIDRDDLGQDRQRERGRVARGRNGSHRHTQPRRNIFVRHLPTQHFVPHFVAAAASDGTDIEYGKTQEPWQKGLFPLPVMEKRHDGRPVVANEPGPPVIRFEQYDLMPFATKSIVA